MFLNIALVSRDLTVESAFLDILQRYLNLSSVAIKYGCFPTCLDFMHDDHNLISFDVIFLDEIHNKDCLALAEKIRCFSKNHQADIIFLTDSCTDFQQISNLQPLYCLSLPIDDRKVAKVIEIAQNRKLELPCTFKFIDGNNTCFCYYKDIIYFYVEKNLIYIYSKGQKHPQSFYSCLSKVEHNLKAKCFTRIHRSYLVNNLHIKKYKYDELTMSNGEVLPIGQTYRKNAKKIISTL